MSGFIGALFGLFGGKKGNNQATPQSKEAFFLDSDSASSLGNVDFMRKPNTIKRSFPKAAGRLNVVAGEVEDSISSMEKRKVVVEVKTPTYSSTYVSSTPTSSSTQSSTSTFKPTTVAPRRSVDSGMDMFRNMAKDIKSKK